MGIDDFRKYARADVASLTWEVIEARGIEAGDVMALWRTACQLAVSAPIIMQNGEEIVLSMMRAGMDEEAKAVLSHYEVLHGYLIRDIAEICKFLVERNFHFPEIEDGELDD